MQLFSSIRIIRFTLLPFSILFMARRKTKKENNVFFSKVNFTESYTSLILGAIVVLVIGILFFSFAKGNRNIQTSSVSDESRMEQTSDDKPTTTSSTYTIKAGDDLWSISENIYSNGYKWLEIAKVNKLKNPGLIHVGNKLSIPKIEKEKMTMQDNMAALESNKIITNSAISGTTYTIKEGDNLWDISVRAYGDGFKWPELAKANNISNPDLIYPNNILKLPR